MFLGAENERGTEWLPAITEAERRFRVRIGIPAGGLGQQLTLTTAWLDENCGAGGWAMTPSGIRGVLNDAVSIYFRDPALASPFVSRWCIGYTLEPGRGRFQSAHR